MSTAHTHLGAEQSDTPLPQVAARAARQAFAAARPHTFTVVQTAARLLLTGAIITGLSSLFAVLIANSLH